MRFRLLKIHVICGIITIEMRMVTADRAALAVLEMAEEDLALPG